MRGVEEELQAARDLLLRGARERPEWRKARETEHRLHKLALDRCTEVADWLRQEVAYPDYFVLGDERYVGVQLGPIAGLTIDFSSGWQFRGLIEVKARFTRNGATEWSGPLFFINYREPTEHAEKRFRPWLEEALAQGLREWRKTLA